MSTLGKQIDSLYKLRQKRLAAEKKIAEMKGAETELSSEIQKMLGQAGLAGAKGSLASASTSPKLVGQVEDWDAFYRYVGRTKNFSLFQRRLNNGAVLELWDDKKKVPGVVPITVTSLSVTKISK